MGNNVAAGHVLAATGLPQAVGFHKTLGQMMYQYNITPWDPKVLLGTTLQRQIDLQRTSPLRFIQVGDGMKFYGAQLGGVINVLNRERFVEMSMALFKMKGLHVPVEEAKLFYDIFDSIDIYQNAQLSIGELAGGLSSFFGGTFEDKANAVFDLLAGGKDQIPMSSLQEFLKPYVWCMVPPGADVLRPVLLPHVTQEISNDISFNGSGYITRPELQRWAQKGQFSQGAVEAQHASMSFTIIDRAALAISIALRLAWAEYEEKYKLQAYGQQTWQQNYGAKPQYITDVGAYRYAQQTTQGAAPAVTAGASTAWQTAGTLGNQFLATANQGMAGVSTWWSADGGRRESVSSLDGNIIGTGTRRISMSPTTSFGTNTISAGPPISMVSPPSPQVSMLEYQQQVVEQRPPSPVAPQFAAAPAVQLPAPAAPQPAPATTNVPNLFAGIGGVTYTGAPQVQAASPYQPQFTTQAPQSIGSVRQAMPTLGASRPLQTTFPTQQAGVPAQYARPAVAQQPVQYLRR